MKKIFYGSIFFLVVISYFNGCTTSPNPTETIDSQDMQTIGGRVGIQAKRDAHPAWTFYSTKTAQGTTRYTVNVSDVNGANNTDVYTASSSAPNTWFPTWSPSGASISFLETPQYSGGWPWGSYAIKAIDVSVSNGVPSGSNLRTIFSSTTSDSIKIRLCIKKYDNK